MKRLKDDSAVGDYRAAVMEFLNEFGLEGTAILSLTRRTEPIRYNPLEQVLVQGKLNPYIYFLVEGTIQVIIKSQNKDEVLGELNGVILLGEISYFNSTPATATVRVTKEKHAVMLRLPYSEFTDVIDRYPQIKPTLAHIGDMRMISQKEGYSSYSFYMEMIGWKRDRLAINRALAPYLEDALKQALLPLLNDREQILEVGDGPGIVSEIIREMKPELLDNLHLQATHLEDAILNPLQAYPSDFSRAKYLREKFQAIVALQFFTQVAPEEIDSQFETAANLLLPGGFLLVVRLRMVDMATSSAQLDAGFFFRELEKLVESAWPGSLGDDELIKVIFHDADIDPLMEWNPRFCREAAEGRYTVPEQGNVLESNILDSLIQQTCQRVFNPEEIQFHWLVLHASHHGFTLHTHRLRPEVGFFYQLYRLEDSTPPN